jgi:hypothetical protein
MAIIGVRDARAVVARRGVSGILGATCIVASGWG